MQDSSYLLSEAAEKHGKGDLDGALMLYRRLLKDFPHHPEGLHMMGVIALQKGNPPLALNLIEASLAIHRDDPQAWYNRALVLKKIGRKEDALRSVLESLSLEKHKASTMALAGNLYQELGLTDQAINLFEEALRLDPRDISICNDFAICLLASGNIEEAHNLMKSINDQPSATTSITRGNIYKAAGYLDEALTSYQMAHDREPQNAAITATLATALLLDGQTEKGRRLYEKREDRFCNKSDLPYWDGSHIDHLLLYDDQGLGDTIQMLRYIKMITQRIGRLTLATFPSLMGIIQSSFPELSLIDQNESFPKADAKLRLMSLPSILGDEKTLDFREFPYLKVSPKKQQIQREHLLNQGSPRIGLVWSGNPQNKTNRQRSMNFDEILPFIRDHSSNLVSLQKGYSEYHSQILNLGVTDADTWLDDFEDTAALLLELDLLITVDTSILHLAGALNIPVWGLLAFDPDYRWQLHEAKSALYPTLTLFRQSIRGSWGEPLDDIRRALKASLASRNYGNPAPATRRRIPISL